MDNMKTDGKPGTYFTPCLRRSDKKRLFNLYVHTTVGVDNVPLYKSDLQIVKD